MTAMAVAVPVTGALRRARPAIQVMSPRHPEFTSAVLRPLAARHGTGESERRLVEELFEIIHQWAASQARAQSAGLPPHADRCEVASHVMRLAWEACVRIDWTRYESWPALLERKVSHARTEAARAEDWLSRRERVYRRRFQRELARREQELGRPLSGAEREEVARAVAPPSTKVDWAETLLAARHPSTVGEVPDAPDDLELDEEVELRIVGRIRAQRLRDWLDVLAAQDPRLVDELSRWTRATDSADRVLPARLARRVEPYAPLLLGMLWEAA